MKKIILIMNCLILSFGMSLQLFAAQFNLPETGDVVGEVNFLVSQNENLLALGQRYNVGVNAITNANPGYKEGESLPTGQTVTVPTAFILPPIRQGIVINLPEMRMYFFQKNSNRVLTFPIGIGKVGKTIPTAYTQVARKTVNPTWFPTKNIRDFNREQGIDLPKKMGPGPDNPLGPYAIYLKIPTYLIHSTIFPASIGKRASFGCIRMNETDIKEFYPLVQAGMPVAIIDQPTKIGWQDNKLYLEIHPPLLEKENETKTQADIVKAIKQSIPTESVTLINWQAVSFAIEQRDGIPHEIGVRVS